MAEVENLNPNNNQVNERRILLICKDICSKVFRSSLLLHPAYFTQTLIQLGYEPFPLEKGKSFIFFGSNTFFLPNYYRYLNNMYLLHGFKAIYTGVGGCILEKFLRLSCGFVIFEVLNRHYQEIGGNIDDLKDLNNLDNYQLFLIKLRTGIRETIQVVLCSVISRPFTVVAIRQIAQLIGNETKYLPINPFQPLLLIGAEEGPPGLFSGLMPLIVNGLISVWGTTICIYLVDIVYNKMVIKLNMKVEEDWENLHPYEKQQLAEHLQLCVLLRYNVCNLIVPSLVGFVQYPFKLCSNLMAAAGSGLLASLLPYSPTFNNWFDTYNYLAQNCELYRGVMPYLRREKGSIQVGPDNKLYGSKKHFI